MISIVARKTTRDDICSLNVYIKNRQLNINTYVSMKVKLPVKEWNQDMQLPKKFADERPVKELNGMSYAELGNKILSIRKKLSSMEECQEIDINDVKAVINSVMNESYIKEVEQHREEVKAKHEKMTVVEWAREFIRQCETGERLKQKSTQKVSPGTLKSWRSTLSLLEGYQAKRHKIIGFEDVTMELYDDLKRYFVKKDYSPNTIGRHIKTLKIFLFAARDMKLTQTTDFESSRFSADFVDVDNVYLTEERVQQMYEFKPTDAEQLKKALSQFDGDELKDLKEETEKEISRAAMERTKDVFVVGCLTGQRVSDYKRINSSMVETLRDGRSYIRLTQKKTGKEVFLPLDERVEAILNKYGGKLPKVYDQKINDHVKVVGHLLGWTEPAGLMERRGLMEYKSKKRFYECIKTHTARRTFATNAYKNGVSLSSIIAITGHSTEQMLRKYLKLDNKERAILAAEEFEKLKKAE